MIVNVKFFYEETDADYEEYNKLWDANRDRFIFLHKNISPRHQLSSINHDIDDVKDILAVRFPTKIGMQRNRIIRNVLNGRGIAYNQKIWYPAEVWVYCPERP